MYGIDTWARIFKARTWEELRMAVKNNEYMEEAVETMYTLNADKTVRQQCEARRRAEIEEKYLQDEMDRLTKEKDELTKKMNQMTEEKDQMTKDIDRLKQESDIWKEKYEKLLAEQND